MAENKRNTSAKNTSTKKTSTTKTNTKNTKTTAKKSTSKNSNTKKSTNTKVNTTKNVVKEQPVAKEVKPEIKVEENVKNISSANKIKDNLSLIVLCVICVLLIINIILICIGHKAKLSNGKEIIASVDGKVITTDELYNSIKVDYGTNQLVNMIDTYLIDKEITNKDEAINKAKTQAESIKAQYETMGYKWDDVLKNYGYDSEQALIDEIVNSLVKEEIAVKYITNTLTQDEIQKYYDENVYDSYTAKHILIAPVTSKDMTEEQVNAEEEKAKATALEVIAKLNNGENWSDLVKAYSSDTGSKENDGLIENFTKGEVVDEFFNATKNLADNTYTQEPVKSKYGYHIIYRVSKTDKEALDDIKDELISEIVEQKMANDETLYAVTWDSIRKKYNLEINDTEIKNYYEKAIKGE